MMDVHLGTHPFQFNVHLGTQVVTIRYTSVLFDVHLGTHQPQIDVQLGTHRRMYN